MSAGASGADAEGQRARAFGPPLLLCTAGGVATVGLLAEAAAWPAGFHSTLLLLAALSAMTAAALGGLGVAALRTRELTRAREAPLEIASGHIARPLGARRAALLSAALLSLATLFSLGLDALARAGGLSAGANGQAPPALENRTDARNDAPGTNKTADGGPGMLLDPDRGEDTSLEHRVSLISTAPVLEVRSTDGRLSPGRDALFLRGFVLSTFDASGRPAPVRSDPRRVVDARGRLSDPLGEARGIAETAGLEIAPLGPHAGIVFAPAPLRTLDVQSASVEDARGLLITRSPAPWTLRVERPSLALDALARARSFAPKDRGERLPRLDPESTQSAALQRLTARARELTRRAPSDLDRVVRVVRHFREEYAYDLFDTRFQTPRGCVDLLARRTGSCTHFASAASLMLRSLGIRARVAAGYVAHETTGDGAWLVRMRDGHAWIEVWFEGFGWLPFDPTPAPDDGTRAPWAPLDLPARESVAPLAALFQSTLRALTTHVSAWGAVGAALALVLLAWLLRSNARRQRHAGARKADGPGRGHPPEHAPLARQFSAALARAGMSQGTSEAPLAFARRAERALGAPDGTLARAVEALLAAASGPRPLHAQEASRIEAAGRWLASQEGRPV